MSPPAGLLALNALTEYAVLEGMRDLDRGEANRHKELERQLLVLPRQCRDKRASYPLGVLFARGVVQSADHYAGRRYAALFVAAVRPLGVPSILADIVGRGAVSSWRDATVSGQQLVRAWEMETAYRRARQELDREGIRVVRVVDEVVVYEEGMPAAGSPRLRWLLTGLRALGAHFEKVDALRRAREA
jgi:hypothetical protein